MLLDLVLMQTRRMKRDLFDEMRVRKDLLVHKEDFKLTQAELREIELAKSDTVISDRGITLMYMPDNGKDRQEGGEYTFNPNIIFSSFSVLTC